MLSQTAAKQGIAELCILTFKTTWSEFQMPSQTAAEQGVAKLLILDFNYFNIHVCQSWRPTSEIPFPAVES